jgi:hypothetical protein
MGWTHHLSARCKPRHCYSYSHRYSKHSNTYKHGRPSGNRDEYPDKYRDNSSGDSHLHPHGYSYSYRDCYAYIHSRSDCNANTDVHFYAYCDANPIKFSNSFSRKGLVRAAGPFFYSSFP